MLAVLAGPAAAQAALSDEGASTAVAVHYYADDDAVEVVSSALSARLPIGRTIVDVAANVDAVTAASIDVTSNASPRAFDELRVEGGAGLSYALTPTARVRARVVGSTEHDYRSLHLSVGVRLDLAERNSTLDLEYGAAIDRVGKRGEPAFSRPHGQHRVVATFTQVLGERSYADLVLDGELTTGFQGSAYRYVPILDAQGARLYALPERVPEHRWGGSAVLRLRRALGERVALHADYRFYGDSWGITSHTVTALALCGFLDRRLTLGAQARAYFQDRASFYQAVYHDAGGAPAWRTRDRALGGVRTLAGGLIADLSGGAGGDGPHAFASLEVARFTWLDFPLQAGRTAAIAGLGLEVPW